MSRELADDEGKRKYTLFLVKPYKVKELAAVYYMPVRTFQRWLYRIREKIGKVEGQYLRTEQVEVVIQHYKLPYFIRVEVLDEDTAETGKQMKKSSDKN